MSHPGTHLTEARFADLLAGNGTPETYAHLRVCEVCRHEAEELGAAVGDLRSDGLAWAQARVEDSLAFRAQTAALAPRSNPSLLAFPSVFPRSTRAAAAILLACAAMGGVLRLSGRNLQVHEHAPGTLSEDDRLLLSIDQELSAQEPSPRDVYAIRARAERLTDHSSGSAASGSSGGPVRE